MYASDKFNNNYIGKGSFGDVYYALKSVGDESSK